MPPVRGSCTQCPPGECVAYSVFSDVFCYCGHPEGDHIMPTFVLPPRLGCTTTGCSSFLSPDTVAAVPGQTLCQRPGCGRLYTAHKHIPDDHVSGPPPVSRATNVNPAMAMVPSRAASAAMWGEGHPPGVVGDARRRLAAAHHRTFGPETGSSFPRVAHRPYSNAQRLGTSSRAATSAKPQRKLKMLIFKFKIPLGINATEDTELIFYSQLHQSITQHMTDHYLRFSGVPPATFNASMPPASDPDALNAWHAMTLLKLPWTVVALGIKPKAGFRRKLCAAAIPWYNFKISALAKAWTSLPDKVDPGGVVYFVGKSIILIVLRTRFTNCSGPAPRHGPLEGPLLDRSNTAPHRCLAFHVQHQLGDLNDFTLTDCIPDICPSSNTDNSVSLIICQVVQMLTLNFQVVFSATSNPSSNTGDSVVPSATSNPTSSSTVMSSGPLFLDLDSANDGAIRYESLGFFQTDKEAEQIRQIIELSRLTAPGQSSSSQVDTEVGPSRRPLPQPPATSIRRRSPSTLPRRSTRRRLNLADSASASSASRIMIPLTFYSVAAWEIALANHLTSTVGSQTTLRVGTSIGEGVGRTIMTAPMDEVFSDRRIWKTVGTTKVLAVLSPGLQPDAKRLGTLRAYGYACRFYVVNQKELPASMSLALAYALLAPNGESDLIHDPALMRMYAPRQLQILDGWAKQPSDFEEKKNDPALRELTLQYFELMPQDPSLTSLSNVGLAEYTTNLTRQVVFGCRSPFAETPDICAFRKGFNGPINPESPMTLGQTFGSSLGSLVIKMSSGRLQHPDELIARLKWITMGDPSLRASEALYERAFIRYLRGTGRVHHPLFPAESQTEFEQNIAPEDPLIRSLIFLMCATRSPLLPLTSDEIELCFLTALPGPGPDPASMSPTHNPNHWLDSISPVKARTCFTGVEMPLRGVTELLAQPIPDDSTTATDFDIYQYISYRPITRHYDFGGMNRNAYKIQTVRAPSLALGDWMSVPQLLHFTVTMVTALQNRTTWSFLSGIGSRTHLCVA
ncbi:hypothetical protein C8R45DRAFT_923436 [Mycena sanguinolenta]|nr:hypothetical protein C8R45DRAFT_923436 [Mycena sanguinolenta]